MLSIQYFYTSLKENFIFQISEIQPSFLLNLFKLNYLESTQIQNGVDVALENFKLNIAEFRQYIEEEQTVVRSMKTKLDLFQDPVELRKWIIKNVKDASDQNKYLAEAMVAFSYSPYRIF